MIMEQSMGKLFSKDVYAPIRPNRIGEQLPYMEFETDESSVFWRSHLLQDGSLAMCWKTRVPPSYSYDNGVLQSNGELITFLENLPMNYEMQIIITSHNNLTDRMDEYLSLDSGVERGAELRQSRAEKLLDAGFRGYKVSENAMTMLRDTYMIVTLRAKMDLSESLGPAQYIVDVLYRTMSLFGSIIPGVDADKFFKGFLDHTVRSMAGDFKESILTAESTLNEMFGIVRENRMSLTDLKKHYWTAYAPSYKDPDQKVSVDPHVDFNEQCFPLPIEHEYDIVKIGKDYHGIVMLAVMPDVVGPDYMRVIRRTLPTQYTFFANIAQANQIMEKMKITLSATLRKRMAGAISSEEAEVYAQEASEVKYRMFAGRKIVYTMVGCIIHGYSKKEVEDRILRVNSNFKKLSIVPDVESTMALQAVSYSWPLVWTDEFTTPFARTRRVLSDDLVDLLPNHGHWSGTKNPQAVYVNRDGEVTFFDHTSPDFVNWHYAITGTSGSGKSFAVVDLVLQLFAAGVERQFLMTIKDDYDRFAQTMGRSIIIDLDRPDSCINPFAGVITKTRLQQWTTALELMLAKGEPTDTLTIDSRLLEQVVQYAYEMVPDGDILRPTWLKEAFSKFPYTSEEQRAQGVAASEDLGSYCASGVYGRLFDGPPSITEKDRLVVFNLQNVLSEKISNVIINSIFTMLDNVMYMGERSAKKHLLVDEMVSMVSSKGGEEVAGQLKRAFRTYRSLNCMCGIASQNEEDLTTDVGAAIVGNITKRIILKPKKEMIPHLMQSLGLRSERHEGYIASLDTKPGLYSEFYLMSPIGEVVCRLLTDRLTFALATTMPEDVGEIQKIKDEMDGDWWKATIKFSQLYPQGVRAHRAQQKQEQERQQRSSTR